MADFKCKMCGAPLELEARATTATCNYCGSIQTLPNLNDDKIARLYDRANHFRRNNEFDKAMGIYEQILDENAHDAESYWSLVLCRYGIEYVEDPVTRKRMPTINRAQFTSIFDDDNYKSALKYADASQKAIYEEEAKTINEIQKGILEISQKEKPFDVFICYKETDEKGQRTRDSVYANDLYHQLTQEGFKVFFSRITLEDKLGVAYEPYIFAALNSAKIMVVIGSRPEFFNAVWVRNEWSRYLALIKNGAKKTLIPAYANMDPYDLPQEFSHLQALDMTRLGFMPDLIRGIKKIIGAEAPKPERTVSVPTRSNSGGDTDALLKRIEILLDNQDWGSADAKCEALLDIDPENAKAYVFKLMAQLQISKMHQLADCTIPLDSKVAFRNAVRYADERLSDQLQEYSLSVRQNIQRIEEEKAEKARIANERMMRERRKANQQAVVSKLISEQADLETAKEAIEHNIFRNQTSLKYSKSDTTKNRILGWLTILSVLCTYASLFIGATSGQAELAGVMVICFFLNIILAVWLAKRNDRSGCGACFVCYITLGFSAIILAFMCMGGKRRIKNLKSELERLQQEKKEMELKIEANRRSLEDEQRKLNEM